MNRQISNRQPTLNDLIDFANEETGLLNDTILLRSTASQYVES